LLHYLNDSAKQEIPIWQMISAPITSLHVRVESWVKFLGTGEVLPSQSTVGGGSLPDETLPTYVLALTVRSPNRFLEQLRICQIPVIARLEDDKVIFDPRTVLPEQEKDLLAAIQITLENRSRGLST
jgi:L-seryl-tRNA(Ser) seleniumtransferase